MSTYWGYYCRDCNVASDHWFNHGEEMLAEFYNAWQVVREMKFERIRVATDSQWADSDMHVFLEEHDSHDIALQNEYGDIQDMPTNGGRWSVIAL